VVRRTASIAPAVVEEPPKKSRVTTVILALLLVGVIVFGFNKLRPEFQAARELNKRVAPDAPALKTSEPESQPQPEAKPSSSVLPGGAALPASASVASAEAPKAESLTAVNDPPAKKPSPQPAKSVSVPEVRKAEPSVTPAASEYKAQIEDALAHRNLAGRVKVEATSGTLTLTGKLRPSEHSALLHFMRNAPANVRVVDEIAYDDTLLPSSENADNSGHPVASSGSAAVHVITDVIGANATLYGPSGRAAGTCQTPCSFTGLGPGRYSLQVQKGDFRPVQTALELKMGDSQDQKIQLESLQKGLYVTSHPAGADIFINGDKQSGQTPATLPLAGGSYNLVLRLEGYEPYSGQVQVKDNRLTSLDLELKPRAGHVAWADVTTSPAGAEILVDGVPTGQNAPARVQIPSGTHTVGLRLDGYVFARRGVQASEGGTVQVNAVLQKK
jgi:hypothetical protein